jgi:hypothetical protein
MTRGCVSKCFIRQFVSLLALLLALPLAVMSLPKPVLLLRQTFDGWEGDTQKSFRIQDGALWAERFWMRILTTIPLHRKSYTN